MFWTLIIGIFAPAFLSPILFVFAKKHFDKVGLISASFYLLSFLCIIFLWNELDPNEPKMFTIPWVPIANVNLSFLVDGLSLFFAFLVSGIGLLVNFYANYYMNPNEGSLPRFYFYLNLFATGMLGTVFANNLLLMFIFWEITGVTSFLLIGYFYQDKEIARTSRMIFLLTSLTSLSLLMGIILIGVLNETFEWTEIVNVGIAYGHHEIWSYIVILSFLVGIFGKSAQIPFHFWLPKAMVAPTPVSAYLHAATMVKLGVYLTARIYPLFVNHPIWFPTLTIVCYATMLLGAALSLLSNDMKALLAYATVSQLGFFIGFYGIGDDRGVSYDFILILNHAFYKGSLFMLAGVIYHATGIRDIRYLGGLWNKLPLTMVIFLFATAAMIGIPGTTGFISKEVMIKEFVSLGKAHSSGLWILSILVTALILQVTFSIRFFFHLFARESEHIETVHPPKIQILIPSLILSSLATVLGVWPAGLQHFTQTFFVSGLHKTDSVDLYLWHGWSLEALISPGILVSGVLLFILAEKLKIWWIKFPMLDFGKLWLRILDLIEISSKKITKSAFTPSPDTSLSYLFGAIILGVLPLLVIASPLPTMDSIHPLRFCVAFFMVLATLCIPFVSDWISKLIAVSVSGFLVTLFFVLFKAPDLAMTQLLVEVVTIFITLALFWTLRKNTHHLTKDRVSALKILLSIGTGLTAGLIATNFHGPYFSAHLQEYFIKTSLPLAKGANVVNTVLIDFRGFDTLGEITVLVIATVGVVGILIGQTPPWVSSSKKILFIPSRIFEAVVPFIFFVVNTLAFYLLLRGHHLPGGGFIAGLASGISFILLNLSIQQSRIIKMIKINLFKLCIFGLSLVFVSCILPMFMGKIFLSHYIIPVMNTAFLFEIGIFMIVLGMSTTIVFSMRNAILCEE